MITFVLYIYIPTAHDSRFVVSCALSLTTVEIQLILQELQNNRDQLRYGLDQWEKALHSNPCSHWPSPYPDWSLYNKTITKHSKVMCIFYGTFCKFGGGVLIVLCVINTSSTFQNLTIAINSSFQQATTFFSSDLLFFSSNRYVRIKPNIENFSEEFLISDPLLWTANATLVATVYRWAQSVFRLWLRLRYLWPGINSMWPSDTIWRQKYRSTLHQAMASSLVPIRWRCCYTWA